MTSSRRQRTRPALIALAALALLAQFGVPEAHAGDGDVAKKAPKLYRALFAVPTAAVRDAAAPLVPPRPYAALHARTWAGCAGMLRASSSRAGFPVGRWRWRDCPRQWISRR